VILIPKAVPVVMFPKTDNGCVGPSGTRLRSADDFNPGLTGFEKRFAHRPKTVRAFFVHTFLPSNRKRLMETVKNQNAFTVFCGLESSFLLAEELIGLSLRANRMGWRPIVNK